MVDRKLEELSQTEKQALRWHTAKFGKAGKAEMERELKDMSDLPKLCRAYAEAKMHREINKQTEARLKQIFTPEEWEARERLHAELRAKRGRG